MPSPSLSTHEQEGSPLSPRPGSLDGDGGGPTTARQRKRRDLLKQYYGIAEQTAPFVPASPLIQKERPPDPLDRDSNAFNYELHVNKILNEMSLPDLIQHDNELVADIKQLDGDMKTLVYENYSKFISATDTVRQMRSNVEKMENQMEELSRNMAKISNASSTIDVELQEQRAKLAQLHGADNLLKRLNFVIELPRRLAECVKREEYAQAVRYYSRVSNLLQRYRHMPLFSKIDEECHSTIEKASRLIRQKLNSEKATLDDTTESVKLLLGLEIGSPIELSREYLRAGHAKLQSLKSSCLVHMETIKIVKTDSSSELSADPLPGDVYLAMEKIKYIDDHFLTEFSKFVQVFCELFYELPAKSGADPVPKSNYFAKMSPEQQLEAKTGLGILVDATIKEYLQIVDKLLAIPDDITKVSPLSYIHVLDRVHKDVQLLEPLRRIGRMDKKVNAMSFELLSKVVTAIFGKIKKEFFNRYLDLEPKEGMDLAAFVRELNTWMKNTLINQHLPILEKFISPNIDFMKHSVFGTDDILDQVQRGLDVFWLSFTEDMLAISNPSRESKQPQPAPLVSLVMSRSALELSLGTVEGVMSAYTDVLFSRKGDHEMPAQLTPSRSKPQLMVVTASGGTVNRPGIGRKGPQMSGTSAETMARAREISSICRNTAQALAKSYVSQMADKFSLTVQDYLLMKDWSNGSYPGSISPVWTKLLQDMSRMEGDVGQMYSDDGTLDRHDRNHARLHDLSGRRGSTHHHHSRNNSQAGGAAIPFPHSPTAASLRPGAGAKMDLMSHIDKLFAERIIYYGPVDLTKPGILTSIAKLVVKSILEALRLVTLGKLAFQQLQVDVAALRLHMYHFCVDERLFTSLMDDIQTCIFNRCIDPVPLEPALVNTIIRDFDRNQR
ncbi:hypothetical protein DFS34DRAFT_603715 [Phlyctochytrium arcticum]|nr:hypothetical protein DFS34DRAFT_603715 [Phlyctochytrium arcticum]